MATKRALGALSLEFLLQTARREAPVMLDVILYHDAGCPQRVLVLDHLRAIGWSISDLISHIADNNE